MKTLEDYPNMTARKVRQGGGRLGCGKAGAGMKRASAEVEGPRERAGTTRVLVPRGNARVTLSAAAKCGPAATPTIDRSPGPVVAPPVRASRASLEYELRFAVITQSSGRVEMRYFAHPRDVEGVNIRLSPRERESLAHALAVPGGHFITRDDVADQQLTLSLRFNPEPERRRTK